MIDIREQCFRPPGEAGGSAVEYGLLAAAVAAVIAASVFMLGHATSNLFGNTCSSISSGANGQMGQISC